MYLTLKNCWTNLVPVDSSFADRVWYALHCLPRSPKGEPPPYLDVEVAAQLSNGTLSKLLGGTRKGIHSDSAARLAKALKVSLAWLVTGEGDGPTLTGPISLRLPYSVNERNVGGVALQMETLRSVTTAVQYVYRVAQDNPDAAPLELLLKAQLLALKDQT